MGKPVRLSKPVRKPPLGLNTPNAIQKKRAAKPKALKPAAAKLFLDEVDKARKPLQGPPFEPLARPWDRRLDDDFSVSESFEKLMNSSFVAIFGMGFIVLASGVCPPVMFATIGLVAVATLATGGKAFVHPCVAVMAAWEASRNQAEYARREVEAKASKAAQEKLRSETAVDVVGSRVVDRSKYHAPKPRKWWAG